MASVMQITGEDRQPSANASPGNALFLLFYNLVRRRSPECRARAR